MLRDNAVQLLYIWLFANAYLKISSLYPIIFFAQCYVSYVGKRLYLFCAGVEIVDHTPCCDIGQIPTVLTYIRCIPGAHKHAVYAINII